jgi:hypothetical protein
MSTSSFAKLLAESLKVDGENNNLPTPTLICQELFQEFGGVQGFVKDMVQCFRLAKPGSQVQARLAESMVELVTKLSDRGLLGDSFTDAEALDDDELELELQREAERAAKAVYEAQHVGD